MTKGALGSVCVAVWLGCFTAAAVQFPPDVLVDKYLLQAEMLSEEKDHKGALEAMDRVVALQKEHDLRLPEAFPFYYAQTALTAGSVQAAIESVNRYLSVAGRAGKYYREALELLVKAERKLREPDADRAEIGKAEPEIEPQAHAVPPALTQAQETTEAQPVVDCEQWNTEEYFKAATVESVTTCLNAGADPNVRGKYKIRPLHWASAYTNNPSVIKALVAAGADLQKRTRDGRTLLHLAAQYNENPAIAQALLDAGANPNRRAGRGRRAGDIWPLHLAAQHNENPAVVEALLKAGANPNARDGNGRTPLYLANKENKNPAVSKVLLAAGAGRVEQQIAAAKAQRKARSGGGSGGLGSLIAAATVVGVGTASGASTEAILESLEAVASSQPAATGGGQQTASKSSVGTAGSAGGGGPCLIPNFPNHDPKSVTDIEIPWCPSGGPQVKPFAGMAVVYQCSLSMLEDPEKIREVRRRIAEYCKRLDAMKSLGGDYHCQCPPGFGQ